MQKKRIKFLLKLSYDDQHIHIAKHFERETIIKGNTEVERGEVRGRLFYFRCSACMSLNAINKTNALKTDSSIYTLIEVLSVGRCCYLSFCCFSQQVAV